MSEVKENLVRVHLEQARRMGINDGDYVAHEDKLHVRVITSRVDGMLISTYDRERNFTRIEFFGEEGWDEAKDGSTYYGENLDAITKVRTEH